MANRIKPKFRISWSAVSIWLANKHKNKQALLDYFNNVPGYTNHYIRRGKILHYLAEVNDISDEIIKNTGKAKKIWKEKRIEIDKGTYIFTGVIDLRVLGDDLWIIDYKSGSIKGVEKQLSIYNHFDGDDKARMGVAKLDDDGNVSLFKEIEPIEIDWDELIDEMIIDISSYIH